MKHIYLLGFFVASMWGATFAVTKLLILAGLSPMQIMIFRFAIAYVCMFIFAPRPLFARNIKDELLMVVAGVMGGSLYFVTENTALQISLASNVSIIIASAPILTQMAAHLLLKGERMTRKMLLNSIYAFVGVVLVVFNGHLVLEINPVGDLLALVASICWALYSVVLRELGSRGYSIKLITRKLFFYGVATLLPFMLFKTNPFSVELLQNHNIYLPLLFLGVVASFGCYLVWGYIVKKIGPIKSAPFIYLVPLVSMVLAAIILKEPITPLAVCGMILILVGVIRGEKRDSSSTQQQ